VNKYRTVQTDKKVATQAVRYFRWRAERFAQKWPPLYDGYHLRIEKVGLFKYEINAYQNVAVPITGGD
jgi:hypothetical protein